MSFSLHLSLCLSVCLCMYDCMYVCMYACMSVCLSLSLSFSLFLSPCQCHTHTQKYAISTQCNNINWWRLIHNLPSSLSLFITVLVFLSFSLSLSLSQALFCHSHSLSLSLSPSLSNSFFTSSTVHKPLDYFPLNPPPLPPHVLTVWISEQCEIPC